MTTEKEGSIGGTRCAQSNVGYEGTCARCCEVFAYMGETSRTAYTRLSEHLTNYRADAAAGLPPVPPGARARGGKKSWMWEHVRNYHDGVVGDNNGMTDFNVKVTGKC